MINKIKLHSIIVKASAILQPDLKFASAEALLTAIAMNESSFGQNTNPRFEKIYGPEGRYFVVDQKPRYQKWGDNACKSYGPWQILYPTACELGFDSSPWSRDPQLLSEAEVSIFYVIEFIKKRVLNKGAKQIEMVFDAFNSGNFTDKAVPTDYIRNGVMAYNKYNSTDYVMA